MDQRRCAKFLFSPFLFARMSGEPANFAKNRESVFSLVISARESESPAILAWNSLWVVGFALDFGWVGEE